MLQNACKKLNIMNVNVLQGRSFLQVPLNLQNISVIVTKHKFGTLVYPSTVNSMTRPITENSPHPETIEYPWITMGQAGDIQTTFEPMTEIMSFNANNHQTGSLLWDITAFGTVENYLCSGTTGKINPRVCSGFAGIVYNNPIVPNNPLCFFIVSKQFSIHLLPGIVSSSNIQTYSVSTFKA